MATLPSADNNNSPPNAAEPPSLVVFRPLRTSQTVTTSVALAKRAYLLSGKNAKGYNSSVNERISLPVSRFHRRTYLKFAGAGQGPPAACTASRLSRSFPSPEITESATTICRSGGGGRVEYLSALASDPGGRQPREKATRKKTISAFMTTTRPKAPQTATVHSCS